MTATVAMFSSYAAAPTGQNRARPTKAQRMRSRMLRSSLDKHSGTYINNKVRSSGSYAASKTLWCEPAWEKRKG
eukprot:COSAG02_NODE_10222_length_1992_cov_3.477021_2_plen_74_part_00